MNTIYNTYKASEEGFDEIMGKVPETALHITGDFCVMCGQPWEKSKQVLNLKSFNRTSALALLESVREMISEVKEKKEQVNGFQPYGIDNFLNDDGESIFFDGFDDGRNLMKIDLLNLIKSVEQAEQLIKQ
jgi:hypothetical protein